MSGMIPEDRIARVAQSRNFGSALVWWRGFQETKLYDFLAALPIILWFALTIVNLLRTLIPALLRTTWTSLTFADAIILLSQLATVCFLTLALVLLAIRHTPKAKLDGIMPKFAAFAGTFSMGLLAWVERNPPGILLSAVSVFLTLGGMCFSIYSLSYLGRSFSLMPEARRLVTTGPYAIVRHPLYFGEAISMLGVALQYLTPLGIAIFVVHLAFQFQRLLNEERILGTLFPEYEAYRMRTARIIPGVY